MATHKLMLAEACATGIITREAASLLNKHAVVITRLNQYWIQTLAILKMNLIVFGLEEKRLFIAQKERATYGLLTNDSMIIAAMRDYGITTLVSADKGFDHISGLTRYEPTDLPKP